MDKRKLIKYFMIVGLTFVLLMGGKFGYDYYNDNVSVMSKHLKEVDTVQAMEAVIDENSVVYVYMGRPNCGDSDVFEEYFPKLIEGENVDNFYYFNIKDIVSEYKKDGEYKDILYDAFEMRYTPTLAKFVDGKLEVKSEWTPKTGYNKEDAENFLIESGFYD